MAGEHKGWRARAVIDSELAQLETEQGRLDQKRDRLLAARAALAGEAVVAAPPTSRVSRAEVTEYLRAHPGSSYTEVAAGLGVRPTSAAKHLSRGGEAGEYRSEKGKWSVAEE